MKTKEKNIYTVVLNDRIYYFVNGKIVKVRSLDSSEKRFFK